MMASICKERDLLDNPRKLYERFAIWFAFAGIEYSAAATKYEHLFFVRLAVFIAPFSVLFEIPPDFIDNTPLTTTTSADNDNNLSLSSSSSISTPIPFSPSMTPRNHINRNYHYLLYNPLVSLKPSLVIPYRLHALFLYPFPCQQKVFTQFYVSSLARKSFPYHRHAPVNQTSSESTTTQWMDGFGEEKEQPEEGEEETSGAGNQPIASKMTGSFDMLVLLPTYIPGFRFKFNYQNIKNTYETRTLAQALTSFHLINEEEEEDFPSMLSALSLTSSSASITSTPSILEQLEENDPWSPDLHSPHPPNSSSGLSVPAAIDQEDGSSELMLSPFLQESPSAEDFTQGKKRRRSEEEDLLVDSCFPICHASDTYAPLIGAISTAEQPPPPPTHEIQSSNPSLNDNVSEMPSTPHSPLTQELALVTVPYSSITHHDLETMKSNISPPKFLEVLENTSMETDIEQIAHLVDDISQPETSQCITYQNITEEPLSDHETDNNSPPLHNIPLSPQYFDTLKTFVPGDAANKFLTSDIISSFYLPPDFKNMKEISPFLPFSNFLQTSQKEIENELLQIIPS